MDLLFKLAGWFLEEIIWHFVMFVLSAFFGTPFILIGAAFDKGSWPASVLARCPSPLELVIWLIFSRIDSHAYLDGL